jgi:hypothetical protein
MTINKLSIILIWFCFSFVIFSQTQTIQSYQFLTASNSNGGSQSTSSSIDEEINDSIYILERIDVVDYSNTYSEQEMTLFKNEAVDEFLHTNIIVDLNSMTMIIADRLSDNKLLYSISIENNLLHLDNCSTCMDSEYKILMLDTQYLILEVKSQDEGVNIFFQLIFKNSINESR